MAEIRHTLKVGASYHRPRKVTGIGIVIHETDKPKRNGMVIDEISELYSDIPAGMTEWFAVFRALEIAEERNYEIVRIRCHFTAVRRKLKKHHKANTGQERDDLQGLILRKARRFKEVTFRYLTRRNNSIARYLARKALQESMPNRSSIQDWEEGQKMGVSSLLFYGVRGFLWYSAV